MDVAHPAESRVVAYDLDQFAALDPDARRPFFEEAGARRGIVVPIIEKDFWVVWTLHVLFSLPDSKLFVFKGGTSLSKAFGLIERFSEDIDLVIDRARFGFVGDNDVAMAPSANQRQRRREELDQAVQTYLRDDLVPKLAGRMHGPAGCVVEVDASDPLTVLVHYQSVDASHSYVRPVVRIETGARADNWPTVDRPIRSYVAMEFPNVFERDEVVVRTIEANRSFLEKLTILHKVAHSFIDGNVTVGERYSRHYYDVYRMTVAGVHEAASLDTELITAVRGAAIAFFPQTKARYEEFQVGSIRIVPSDATLDALRRDYDAMRDMIFGSVPAFTAIVAALVELERRVNSQSNPD